MTESALVLTLRSHHGKEDCRLTTAFGMDKREVPAEGVVTGFGRVNGRMVVVGAGDYTAAGTFGEYHGKKFSQAIDFAKDKGWPFVGMKDSGGARLQEGMDTLQAYAWLFRSQILASGIVPQIALLMGPCLGGQAYHPIMQDFIFQTRKTGFMGIAGPAFVKTQTGVEISLEELCGIKAHAYTRPARLITWPNTPRTAWTRQPAGR